MKKQSQDHRLKFCQKADANIALAMEIVEAGITDNSSRFFLRRSILRRLNNIKRDALAAMQEMEGGASNTTSESVALLTQIAPASKSL